jgi:hypothetical protein
MIVPRMRRMLYCASVTFAVDSDVIASESNGVTGISFCANEVLDACCTLLPYNKALLSFASIL